MWSVYASKGYARHMYYLRRPQLVDAGKLNAISRSLCVISIGIGKISVAFLIERFAGPSRWRKWLLRFISISIVLSATITVILFYAQCQPVAAVWDKSMIKAGTGKCWDPIPLNTWNQIIATACIPTLRPLVLVILNHPSGSQYRYDAQSHRRSSRANYLRAREPSASHQYHRGIVASGGHKAFDSSTTELQSTVKRGEHDILVNEEVRVESRNV
ncbi:MAG: hypothetical protein Q9219_003556 [cf. Caloplaca sp. 3 TL-2023]